MMVFGLKLRVRVFFVFFFFFFLIHSCLVSANTFTYLGLCSDYALIIQFTRIYFSTRKNLGGSNDEQLPLNHQQILPSTLSHEFFPSSVSHPNQIILLILASVMHSI